jgi:hypothetical protein
MGFADLYKREVEIFCKISRFACIHTPNEESQQLDNFHRLLFIFGAVGGFYSLERRHLEQLPSDVSVLIVQLKARQRAIASSYFDLTLAMI